VFEQQRHDAVRVDELPGDIHRADAVGVAVGRQAEVIFAAAHRLDQRLQVTGNWFGVDAVEAGVHLAAQFVHLAARLAQQPRQVEPARAVHRIDRHGEIGGGDGVEIDQRAHMRLVGGEGVEAGDPPLRQRVLVLQPRAARRWLPRCAAPLLCNRPGWPSRQTPP
jgi:hypothetical protein